MDSDLSLKKYIDSAMKLMIDTIFCAGKIWVVQGMCNETKRR